MKKAYSFLSSEEREKRNALFMKAEFETNLAERELGEWRRKKSFDIDTYEFLGGTKISSIANSFEQPKPDTKPSSPSFKQSPPVTEIQKPPLPRHSTDLFPEKETQDPWKKKYEELLNDFQNQKNLHSEEVCRFEKIIDEIQKKREESKFEDQVKFKVKQQRDEINTLKKAIKEKEDNIKKLQQKQETETKVQKEKPKRPLKKRAQSTERITAKTPSCRENKLENQINILRQKKLDLQEEVKTLEKKKEGLLPSKDIIPYYEQRISLLETSLSNWRNKATELATKYYSALKTLKTDLRQTKIEVSKMRRNNKEQINSGVKNLKDQYESVIEKLKRHCTTLENNRKRK